jgi:hypothetical protein
MWRRRDGAIIKGGKKSVFVRESFNAGFNIAKYSRDRLPCVITWGLKLKCMNYIS